MYEAPLMKHTHTNAGMKHNKLCERERVRVNKNSELNGNQIFGC